MHVTLLRIWENMTFMVSSSGCVDHWCTWLNIQLLQESAGFLKGSPQKGNIYLEMIGGFCSKC